MKMDAGCRRVAICHFALNSHHDFHRNKMMGSGAAGTCVGVYDACRCIARALHT